MRDKKFIVACGTEYFLLEGMEDLGLWQLQHYYFHNFERNDGLFKFH